MDKQVSKIYCILSNKATIFSKVFALKHIFLACFLVVNFTRQTSMTDDRVLVA